MNDNGLEVLDGGLGNTVQDGGRHGHRRLGVPLSGAAEPVLLACANRLVGNADATAAIETGPLGPRLRALGPVRVALAGALEARIDDPAGHRRPLPPWRSATLAAGERLTLVAGGGRGYLAVAGGIALPPCLGSRSTYPRAGLGGIAGRALGAGDRLPCGAVPTGPERRAARPFAHAGGPIRVIPGPQLEAFAADALATLCDTAWSVTAETDRMGMRLAGPRLAHRDAADIVSDGVVPGAIQVPADGRPIVLLADAQTVGGYAKLAVAIAADLPRLAQALPGSTLRFAVVDLATAAAARRQLRAALDDWSAAIVAIDGETTIDETLLHSANLISGVVDMRAPPADDPGDRP